jgi:hypothetical protein
MEIKRSSEKGVKHHIHSLAFINTCTPAKNSAGRNIAIAISSMTYNLGLVYHWLQGMPFWASWLCYTISFVDRASDMTLMRPLEWYACVCTYLHGAGMFL